MTGAWTDTTEYRVRAMMDQPSRDRDPGSMGPVGELHSPWKADLEYIARLAQDLRDEYGMRTQVQRRPRAETVNYDQHTPEK